MIKEAGAESNAAIRDVMDDYRVAHGVDRLVDTRYSDYDAVWFLGSSVNNGGICKVRFVCGRTSEMLERDRDIGPGWFHPEIEVRDSAPDAKVLAQTLRRAVSASKPAVASKDILVMFPQIVEPLR
jgi:hypothetical protein